MVVCQFAGFKGLDSESDVLTAPRVFQVFLFASAFIPHRQIPLHTKAWARGVSQILEFCTDVALVLMIKTLEKFRQISKQSSLACALKWSDTSECCDII